MSGASRFRAGAMATLLSQLIHIVGRLALVPMFLAAWGEFGYGEWLTLSAAVAYLSMLDLGVQSHVVNKLCMAWTSGDLAEYRTILHSALRGSLLVCGAILVVVCVVLPMAPIASWLDLHIESPAMIRSIAVLLACQVVVAIPLGVLVGVYRTVGEYGRGVMVENARTLGLLLGTGAVLASGGAPVQVAIVQLIPLVGAGLFAFFDLRGRHPDVPLGIKGFDRGVALSLLAPSLYFLIIQAAMLFTLQGSTVAVHLMFGGAAVTVFCTLRTLANLVRQVGSSLGHALWPQATELFVRGELQTLREVHLLAGKLTLAVTATAGVHLWLLGPDILSVWTDGVVSADPALMLAFLALLVGQGIWSTSAVYLMAWGKQRSVATPMLMASLIGLATGILVASRYQLPGMVWGMGVVELLICGVTLPRLVCRSLDASLVGYYTHLVGRGIIPLGVVAAVGSLLSPMVPTSGWVKIAWLTAALAPLAAWSTFRLWLSASERDRVLRLIGLRGGRSLVVSS